MKKQAYYYLFCLLTSFIGIGAMDQHYNYHTKPLNPSWQRLLENEKQSGFRKKYLEAQWRLRMAERGVNPKGEKVAYSDETKRAYKQNFEQLVQEYKETQEFKEYHEQVKQVNATLVETLPYQNKVISDLSDLDMWTSPKGEIFHDVITHNSIGNNGTGTRKISFDEAKETLALQNQLQELRQKRAKQSGLNNTFKNPRTEQKEFLANDFNSPHYKNYAISRDPKNATLFIINDEQNETTFIVPKKDKKALDYYNNSENAAFHDALQNLQELKAIAQHKLNQKQKPSWWYQFWNHKSYEKQMLAYEGQILTIERIQNEIDTFTHDVNRKAFTQSHVPQKHCNPLLFARYTHKKMCKE